MHSGLCRQWRMARKRKFPFVDLLRERSEKNANFAHLDQWVRDFLSGTITKATWSGGHKNGASHEMTFYRVHMFRFSMFVLQCGFRALKLHPPIVVDVRVG